jgi:hypothetical protein
MQSWKYEKNGGANLCHKSSQQTKPTTTMYNNERRISETKFVPSSSILCGVKTKHSRLKHIDTYEDSIM